VLRFHRVFVLCVLLWLAGDTARADDRCCSRAELPASTLTVDEATQKLSLGAHLDVLEDPSAQLQPGQVLTSSAFVPHTRDVPNYGFSRSAFWFRTQLRNLSATETQLLLELGYPILDEVDLYARDARGALLSLAHTGTARPFATRPVAHRNFLVPLTLAAHEQLTLYLRVRSKATVQVPLTLYSTRAFLEADPWASLIQGLYAGFMLVMILYNLFLFVSLRERSYLLYVAMVFGQLVYQVMVHGLAFALLWPRTPWLNGLLPPLLIPLATWAANAFAMEFLEASARAPRVARAAAFLRAGCLVSSALAPFLSFDLGIALGCLLAALSSAMVVVALLRVFNSAPRPATMLAVAWTPFLCGTLLLVAEKFGLVSRGFWTENLVQIGSAFEVVVLSLALGDRINLERNAKLRAQELVLEHERAAQRAQQEALLVQRRANETLEARVRERTHELAEVNARLAEISTVDPLTGLKNQRHFHERYNDEFARGLREGTPLSVILVDVDHMKRINDTHGHMVGDECLVAIAHGLCEVVARATDVVARFGGDEFLIMLPNTDSEGANKLAEAVRRVVEGLSIEADGELVSLSVSVGCMSRVPARGERRERFLNRASDALFEAKQLGRNRVHASAAD
jgi:diguanylate cyclase (GGDEF)-like protein